MDTQPSNASTATNEQRKASVSEIADVKPTVAAASAVETESNELRTNVMPPLQSLKCRQCKQYFRQPLTLQCLHSFCTSCILSYNGAGPNDLHLFLANSDGNHEISQDTQSKASSSTKASSNSSTAANANQKAKQGAGANGKVQEEPVIVEPPKPKQMLCPTCTEDLHLEAPEEPSEPFPNARLERLVALVHDTPVLCQNCKSSESEVKCNKCESYCCSSCWKITHAPQIFQNHVAQPLQHSQLSALPKCPTHILSDLEFFVTDQEVGACQVCLLKGEHVGRPYSLVTDVRAQRQAEIENELAQVLEQRARLIAGKKECGQVIEELAATLEEQKAAVASNFAAIRAALDEREKETLSALDRLHDAKKGVLEEQIQYVEKVVGQIDDGVTSVKLVLNHSNPLEVVYSVYVLQDALSIIGDVPPTAPKMCSECRSERIACHHPAVDSELPVILSEKVVPLVQAYAAVPDASIVERVAQGKSQPSELAPVASAEQKKLLQTAAGAAAKEEEFGCVLQ